MIIEDEIRLLIDRAGEARKNAFVPRSGHQIGAAILSTDGHIFGGCNIESNISGLGTCAERAAIDNAITNGKYEFKALLVLDKEKTLPCGACLQYLMEFCLDNHKEMVVVSADADGGCKEYTLQELLPYGYLPHHDLGKIKSYKNK